MRQEIEIWGDVPGSIDAEKIDVIEMFAQEIERLFYLRLSAIKH